MQHGVRHTRTPRNVLRRDNITGGTELGSLFIAITATIKQGAPIISHVIPCGRPGPRKTSWPTRAIKNVDDTLTKMTHVALPYRVAASEEWIASLGCILFICLAILVFTYVTERCPLTLCPKLLRNAARCHARRVACITVVARHAATVHTGTS